MQNVVESKTNKKHEHNELCGDGNLVNSHDIFKRTRRKEEDKRKEKEAKHPYRDIW